MCASVFVWISDIKPFLVYCIIYLLIYIDLRFRCIFSVNKRVRRNINVEIGISSRYIVIFISPKYLHVYSECHLRYVWSSFFFVNPFLPTADCYDDVLTKLRTLLLQIKQKLQYFCAIEIIERGWPFLSSTYSNNSTYLDQSSESRINNVFVLTILQVKIMEHIVLLFTMFNVLMSVVSIHHIMINSEYHRNVHLGPSFYRS